MQSVVTGQAVRCTPPGYYWCLRYANKTFLCFILSEVVQSHSPWRAKRGSENGSSHLYRGTRQIRDRTIGTETGALSLSWGRKNKRTSGFEVLVHWLSRRQSTDLVIPFLTPFHAG